MGLSFTSSSIDITLELIGKNGEKKTFYPMEQVTASFCDKVQQEIMLYVESQRSLPEKERDRVIPGTLKQLSWIYKDFDADWCLKNLANKTDIIDVYKMVTNAMNGIKKEGGN